MMRAATENLLKVTCEADTSTLEEAPAI
jgi:hypothetical protein